MKIIPITQTGTHANEHYVDGRPCFSPDGNTVLFERIPYDTRKDPTKQEFWTVDINTNSEKPYYKSDTYGCLRAAWSWNPEQNSKQIAFTGIYSENNKLISRIMLLDENGADNSAIQLEVNGYKKARLSYPAWYPNEPTLLITNYSKYELLKVNINSLNAQVLTDAANYLSGMGTVNPIVPRVIAFAGQPVGPEKYDQKNNKVLLQVGNDAPMVFSELTENIGRAPWFSPDGSIIAFEAHSIYNNLQICMKKVDVVNPQSHPIIPISDAKCNAQHAKFSPDGSKLVWAQSDGHKRSQIYMAIIK